MLNSLTPLIFLETYANGRQSTAHENNPVLLLPYADTAWVLINPVGHKCWVGSTLPISIHPGEKNVPEFRICLGVVWINISFFFFKWFPDVQSDVL